MYYLESIYICDRWYVAIHLLVETCLCSVEKMRFLAWVPNDSFDFSFPEFSAEHYTLIHVTLGPKLNTFFSVKPYDECVWRCTGLQPISKGCKMCVGPDHCSKAKNDHSTISIVLLSQVSSSPSRHTSLTGTCLQTMFLTGEVLMSALNSLDNFYEL